jgi:hypothetical protein
MKKISNVLLFISFTVLLTLTPVNGVLAATNTSSSGPNGYRLYPVRTDLVLNKGSTDIVTVYIQNATSDVENLQTVVDDFEAPTNETGNPALLLNGATAPSHSLKQFATVLNPKFTLQPNQQEAVNVEIKIPPNAESGGYYGAVRFAPIGPGGNKNVNLSASVASLILLTVPGNLIQRVYVSGFGVAQGNSTVTHAFFFSNKNLNAIVRFKNIGNVQEEPFGKILLKKGTTVLSSVGVNTANPPGNVLPDSIRAFSAKLTKVGWFGKYTIEGNFGYGNKGQLLMAQASFYVIPIAVIIITLLIILFILFLIFGLPRLIRAYNRRVIARASRRQQ